MKTYPLRELLRNPGRIKRLTASGQSVRITHRNNPLWVVRAAEPAPGGGDEESRRLDDEDLEAMLAEPRRRTSASDLVLDSRAP